MFPKNIFLVNDDDMTPYVNKGDAVIFEPIQGLKRLYSSVYIVEYRGKQFVSRVQILISGGMRLLFDSGKKKMIEFEQHERMRVVFIGHVTDRILKDGEIVRGYSLYSTS